MDKYLLILNGKLTQNISRDNTGIDFEAFRLYIWSSLHIE